MNRQQFANSTLHHDFSQDPLPQQPAPFTSLDIDRDSPFHAGDWRWLNVQELLGRGRAVDIQDDQLIQLLYNHLISQRNRVGEQHRILEQIIAIHDQNGPVRHQLEARILAGEAVADIARKMALPVDWVSMYEAVFLDVRDSLQCFGWIQNLVLHHRLGGPLTGELYFWRYWGYRYQVQFVDYLSGHCPPPKGFGTAAEYKQFLYQMNQIQFLPFFAVDAWKQLYREIAGDTRWPPMARKLVRSMTRITRPEPVTTPNASASRRQTPGASVAPKASKSRIKKVVAHEQ